MPPRNRGERMAPEPRGVDDCARLREACQSKIFGKMQELHNVQMQELGEIKEEIAFQKGRASAGRGGTAVRSVPSNGERVWVKLLISWGPFIGFLVLIGLATWMKSEGWL